MAVKFQTVTSPGEQVRRLRKARGLTQTDLAKLAGVSPRSITRIENNADYDEPRTLLQVQHALGILGDASDPPLSKALDGELITELGRRLANRAGLLDQIRNGQMPEDFFRRPNVIDPDAPTDQQSDG